MQPGLRVHTWSEAFSISLDYVWKREGGMKSIQQLKELNINIYIYIYIFSIVGIILSYKTRGNIFPSLILMFERKWME